MKLSEITKEIRKFKPVEQHRLKEFFITSLTSFSASEPLSKK